MIVWCTPRPEVLDARLLVKQFGPTAYGLYLNEDAYKLLGQPRKVRVGKSENRELLLKPVYWGGFSVSPFSSLVVLPRGGYIQGHMVWETDTASGLSEFLVQSGFPEGLYRLQHDRVYGCYVAKLLTQPEVES